MRCYARTSTMKTKFKLTLLIMSAALSAGMLGTILLKTTTTKADGDMERIANEMFQRRADYYRTGFLGTCQNTYYPDPADSPFREDVVVGTTLKVGDDIEAWGFQNARIIAPAEGKDFFMVYYVEDTGNETQQPIHVACVTNRAPLDPEETPMPIFTDPEDPRIGQCP